MAAYRAVLAAYPGALVLLDDAHGLGVLGRQGRGSIEHAGLGDEPVNTDDASDRPRFFLAATLSKAVGGYGGIVPGTQAFLARLRRESPAWAGASPPSVPAAAASARALEIIAAQPELRTRLAENAVRLKAGLRGLGLSVADTPTPIAALALGTAANMERIQRDLAARGIWIAYFPTYAGLGPAGGFAHRRLCHAYLGEDPAAHR